MSEWYFNIEKAFTYQWKKEPTGTGNHTNLMSKHYPTWGQNPPADKSTKNMLNKKTL